MSSHFDLATVGPEIGPSHSEALQKAVGDRLLTQTEEVLRAGIEGTLGAGPGIVPELSDSFAALRALQEFPSDRLLRIVLHPSYRYWLQAVRRTSTGSDPSLFVSFVRRLPDFVWAEQAALGVLTRPWNVVTDERGGLRCPSLGRFIEFGPSHANQVVEIAPADGLVGARCQDGMIVRIPPEDLVEHQIDDPATLEEHGYYVDIFPRVAEGRVEVSSREPWLRLKFTGTHQRTNGTQFFGTSDDLYEENPTIEPIDGALDLLREYWPEAFEDFTRFTRVIVPIYSRPDAYLAFTVSSRQGAIYIGAAPLESTIEMLIHENAHVKLRQVQALDTLLSDPLDESIRVSVPWRPDPRPLPGVFEGLYVFAHIAEFQWRRYRMSGAPSSAQRFAQLVRDLGQAEGALQAGARLTDSGVRFFEGLSGWVRSLRDRAEVMK